MIEITIPGRGNYRLRHLVVDLNGTIALDGKILEGVEERLQRLNKFLDVFIVTADTFGSASELKEKLQTEIHLVEKGREDAQKLALVEKLGKEETVSIGNGSNDVSMLRESVIGICVLGREGASAEAIMNSDLIVSEINDALDLLLNPKRLVATLRR
jgi:P-type E1-E2 ATPase